ncbi:hypothetical protein LZ554_001124 [Drepanopeziza brunnea f. sp. 'monogermtubi']|nr:hypothetical protein LZ554_001124 [Drepanopeziza brunnea f. sp. 'monogermtubi']
MSSPNEQTPPKADPSSPVPSHSQHLNAFLSQLVSARDSKDPTAIQTVQALLASGLRTEKGISEQRTAVKKDAASAELFDKTLAAATAINNNETEIASSANQKKPAKAGGCCGCGDCDEYKEKGASESR